jgi:Restriction endonuclease
VSLLSHIEKQQLEREFRMGTGYVLDFSNRTFADFFRECVKINIDDPRYVLGSGSKANRLRAFWGTATQQQLRVFFESLLEGWSLYATAPLSPDGKEVMERVIAKLGGSTPPPSKKETAPETRISQSISDALNSDLLALTAFPPQRRGYAFEAFLKKLFDAYGLVARASFRNTGEQIDGSFVFHNETYLLEAKWQNSPTAAEDLHTFEGKLGQKAAWSRGLFISISGFSTDGLLAFGRGKRIICMDGLDISEVLRNQLSLVDVLATKIRLATETGSPYIPVRDFRVR